MPKSPTLPILIIDDEIESLEGFELMLNSNGFNHVSTCQESRNVMKRLGKKEPSVILLDLSMPHLSGQELLKKISVNILTSLLLLLPG